MCVYIASSLCHITLQASDTTHPYLIGIYICVCVYIASSLCHITLQASDITHPYLIGIYICLHGIITVPYHIAS